MEDFSILSSVISNIDISYIVVCNIVTYIVIQTIESIKEQTIKKGWKRLISTISAFLLGTFMWMFLGHSAEGIFYGFFMQYITWDYMFKGWLKKLEEMSKTDADEETKK